jgi:hypothetical protein
VAYLHFIFSEAPANKDGTTYRTQETTHARGRPYLDRYSYPSAKMDAQSRAADRVPSPCSLRFSMPWLSRFVLGRTDRCRRVCVISRAWLAMSFQKVGLLQANRLQSRCRCKFLLRRYCNLPCTNQSFGFVLANVSLSSSL